MQGHPIVPLENSKGPIQGSSSRKHVIKSHGYQWHLSTCWNAFMIWGLRRAYRRLFDHRREVGRSRPLYIPIRRNLRGWGINRGSERRDLFQWRRAGEDFSAAPFPHGSPECSENRPNNVPCKHTHWGLHTKRKISEIAKGRFLS